jgi:hypothetical protein
MASGTLSPFHITITVYIFVTLLYILCTYNIIVDHSGSAVWGMNGLRFAGIVGSNPTQGMDVFVSVSSVFVLFCV